MDSLAESIYYILTDSDNPALRYFPNNAEISKLAHYLVSKGVVPKQSPICKCPVCNGSGFVPGDFYDIPGVSVSHRSWPYLHDHARICLSCFGTGIVQNKED